MQNLINNIIAELQNRSMQCICEDPITYELNKEIPGGVQRIIINNTPYEQQSPPIKLLNKITYIGDGDVDGVEKFAVFNFYQEADGDNSPLNTSIGFYKDDLEMFKQILNQMGI